MAIDKEMSRGNKSSETIKQNIMTCKKRIELFRFQWWGMLIASFIGGLSGYLFLMILDSKPQNIQIVIYVLYGIIAFSVMYLYLSYFLAGFYRFFLKHYELELLQFGTEELQDRIEEDFFTKLVQINFKYLDQYYLQTQNQADKSFTLTAIASVVGLLIIIAGIVMMFLNITQPAYITCGAGIISEFIAAVFFYLYNRTILKMSQYHQKLVITQNISLALKITDDMPDDTKNKIKEMIIDRLTTDINKFITSKDI